MVIQKKILLLFMLFLLLLFGGGKAAIAQESAVTVSDMDFNVSEAPAGGTGTNSMGTNGVINYAAGYSGPVMGIVGRINLTSTNGRRIRIGCTRRANARNTTGTGGTQNISASQFYIVLGSSNATGPAGGVACNNPNSYVIDTTFNSATHDAILIAADLAADDVAFGGQYSLSNHNKGPMKVKIRFSGISMGNNTINETVDMTAVFFGVLGLTVNADMDFGDIETTGSVGAGDRADIGTNGGVIFGGNFSGAASGVAGDITLSGAADGEVIEVYCDSSAVLTRAGGGGSISVTGIEAAAEGSVGGYGSAGACSGVGGTVATTFTYALGTRDQIIFGGRLDGATAAGTINGSFSTGNAGGNNIDVSVVRQ